MCVLFVYFLLVFMCVVFFFFKQKTAYEMRISDWSSDVCSSDLVLNGPFKHNVSLFHILRFVTDSLGFGIDFLARLWGVALLKPPRQIGRASCRERVCQYV